MENKEEEEEQDKHVKNSKRIIIIITTTTIAATTKTSTTTRVSTNDDKNSNCLFFKRPVNFVGHTWATTATGRTAITTGPERKDNKQEQFQQQTRTATTEQ